MHDDTGKLIDQDTQRRLDAAAAAHQTIEHVKMIVSPEIDRDWVVSHAQEIVELEMGYSDDLVADYVARMF